MASRVTLCKLSNHCGSQNTTRKAILSNVGGLEDLETKPEKGCIKQSETISHMNTNTKNFNINKTNVTLKKWCIKIKLGFLSDKEWLINLKLWMHRTQWQLFVISALRVLRQKDHDLEQRLSYIMKPCTPKNKLEKSGNLKNKMASSNIRISLDIP